MIPINSTFAPIQVLVDELARSGMTHAITCPGSRNAPIALTLAEHPAIAAVSVLDERSAGFMALGIAKTSGRPVAVTVTSGTAAANLLPAVVEAHESGVPLIVLTADRPPELREVGAGQAIDQIKLYGDFAKWFVEVGNLPPGRESAIHHRQLGCRAYNVAAGGRPGPVHLNFPLREPLAPRAEDGLDPADWAGRADGKPWTGVEGAASAAVGAPAILDARRGVVVAGGDAGAHGSAALAFARSRGWPVFAEPTSGARVDDPHVIAHYDLLVRSDALAAERPDVVLRVGEMPTSKPLRAWLAGCPQVVVDPDALWRDPTRRVEVLWIATREGVVSTGADAAAARDEAWLARWRSADDLVGAELRATAEPFEPLAYNALGGLADLIWVSSSLPIRDFESYFPKLREPPRILANRGANGIDGVVSSAAGAAIATGRPVHLVIGELALLHDVGGLVSARRAGAQLAILCVNNGGGGIFDFLPVAEQANSESYEAHIATPVDVDLATVAALGGLKHRLATDTASVREQLEPGTLVELRIDRATSLARHRALSARIVARLDGKPTRADGWGPDPIANLEYGYELFAARRPLPPGFISDDFFLEQTTALPGSQHVFRGSDAVEAAAAELLSGLDDTRAEPKSFERHGDWIIASVDFVAVVRGIEQRTELFHLWKLRGSQAVRMRVLGGSSDPRAEIAKLDAES